MVCLCVGAPWQAHAVDDFSAAETQLFMQDHLRPLKLPSRIHNQFHKSGSLEPGFDDRVQLGVKAKPQGQCCHTDVQFFSKERRLQLPEPEEAKGNPVILYFLERDIRDMQRLTHGQSNYFRTRIRKALYQTAQERQVRLQYKGRWVNAQEFEIAPFVDDPLRNRFAQLADKHYSFTLSDAVPGGLVAIRSWVPVASNASAVWQEQLLLEGASL